MNNLLDSNNDSSPSDLPEGNNKILPLYQFKLREDKSPNEGEDAEPLLEYRAGNGVIAVFDGMGGAGGTTYRTKHGEEHTSAYFASRIVQELISQHFDYLCDTWSVLSITPDILKDLKVILTDHLQKQLDTFEKSPSRLKSRLTRKLPTTLASIYFSCTPNRCRCDVVWAGDSRAYLLLPEGLQQLSRDDIKPSADALADITQDSPLSNCISADNDFELRHVSFKTTLPIILLVATDGCFGYIPTPAHFEHLLLQSLQLAKDDEDWREKISAALKPISGDDYSMALICLGWENFTEIKRTFRDRLEQVDRYIEPIDEIVSKINQLDSQIRGMEQEREEQLIRKKEIYTNFWDSYRVTYEKMMKKV